MLNDSISFYIFQISDQRVHGKIRTAQEIYTSLVKENSIWGITPKSPNRKAIKPGDKVVFYLAGKENQVFVAAATLKSGAYSSDSKKNLFTDPDILTIDLESIIIFPDQRSRFNLDIEFLPRPGGVIRISEKDYDEILGSIGNQKKEDMGFGLEKYLENFIVDNWNKIDFQQEITLFEDNNGNIGNQYVTDVGNIDILAKDRKGNFVVFELKKGRSSDQVVGQTLRYMNWVRKNLCKNGEKVTGVIVVGEKDPKLEYAVDEVKDKISLRLYKIDFKLRDYN